MNAINTQISCVNAGLKQTNRKRSHVQTATIQPLPIAADADCRWLILRAKLRKETALVARLQQNGFKAWLPEVKRFRIRAGRKEKIMTALIPGYVFVIKDGNMEPDPSQMPGSNGWLVLDEHPAQLQHADVLRLQQLCALDAPPEVVSDYTSGQHVTISSGSFKGISGTVTRTDGRRFLVVESGLNGILLKIDMERNVVE